MSETLRFKTYCFELYKTAKGLKGRDAQEIFDRYRVFAYINEGYDMLHRTSDSYILDDIEIYINARKGIA